MVFIATTLVEAMGLVIRLERYLVGRGSDMQFDDALKRLQETELEILKVLADFCVEHEIRWFIDSGTVLGAMRHGGFIPWDDDIDVGMLRADYERFLTVAAQSFPEGYSVHTAENTHGFAGMFAKVYKDGTLFETDETREAGLLQGIFVDIFPYDALSSVEAEQQKQRSGARLWQGISYLYHSGTIVVPHKGALGAIERAACAVAHPIVHALFSPMRIVAKFNAVVAKTGEHASNMMLPFAWPNIQGIPLDVLVPTSELQFEDASFPAPGNAERYLELMYGDWRTLPAPEDRRTHLPKVLDFGDGSIWKA